MSKALSIMKTVCKRHGVTPNELRGRSRCKNLIVARRDYIRLARMQGWSTTVIGRLLNRDHTTIIQHLKVIEGGER